MVAPTWQLLIDWDNAGNYSHAGADVTSRMVGPVEAYRGRDFEASAAAQATPGRLTAQLNNTSGDYSFFNTASHLHGRLVPGHLVQLRATWQGTTYIRWTGHLETIAVSSTLDGLPAVDIQAVGVLGYLNKQEVTLPAQEDTDTGAIIAEILERAGLEVAQVHADPGNSPVDYYFGGTGERRPTDLLKEMEATEAGSVYEDALGGIVSHDRHFRPLNRMSMATFADSGAPGTLGISEVSHGNPLDTVFTRYPADVENFRDDAQLVRVWEHVSAAIRLDPGATAVVDAKFATSAEFIGVQRWDPPDVVANTAADGMGADVTSDVSVSLVAVVTSAVVTLTNTNATREAYVTSLTIDGVRLRRLEQSTYTTVSSQLQSDVGGREFPTRPKFNDPEEARLWGEWQRALFEEPQPVIAITVRAFRDAAHLGAVLGLNISDRISLDLRGSTRIGVNADFFIEHVTDQIDVNLNLRTTYRLISAGPYGQWQTTDDMLDGTHMVGW